MILIHFTKYSAALGAFPSHFFTYANLNLFVHYFKLFANHFCILIKILIHRSKLIRQKTNMNLSPIFQRSVALSLFKSMLF